MIVPSHATGFCSSTRSVNWQVLMQEMDAQNQGLLEQMQQEGWLSGLHHR